MEKADKTSWDESTQFCTVCGRGFMPLSVSHKYSKTTPTCSVHCQEEFDRLMTKIATHQRTFVNLDDELGWEG